MITDQLGGPRFIVNVATGVVAQELTYDEFGRVTADSHPGVQPFGFAFSLQISWGKNAVGDTIGVLSYGLPGMGGGVGADVSLYDTMTWTSRVVQP